MQGQPAKAPHGGYKKPLVTLEEQRSLLQMQLAYREAGLVVNWKVTRRTVHTLLKLRLEGAPTILPGRSWCKKFNYANNFRRRVATKAARKLLGNDAPAIQERFILQIAYLVQEHGIPKGGVVNMDETGVEIANVGKITLDLEGTKQVRVLGVGDKRQVTCVTATAADGSTLPVGIIFAGAPNSRRAIPKLREGLPAGTWTSQTKSHWMTEDAIMLWFKQVMVPFARRRRLELGFAVGQPLLLLLDTYASHLSLKLKAVARLEKILILYIPPGFTDLLQPQDLAINKPFKEKISSLLAEHFEAELLAAMRDGTAVAYEAKLQKSSIGVPFLGAVVRAWKWIASTDEAPTRIRRNAFALYQKCWEPDVQQAAVAKHAEDGGLFAAEGKQRGIPVLDLLHAAIEENSEESDKEPQETAHADDEDNVIDEALEIEEESSGSSSGIEDLEDLRMLSDDDADDNNDDEEEESSGSDSDNVQIHSLSRFGSGGIVNQFDLLAAAERLRREKAKEKRMAVKQAIAVQKK